MRRKSSDNLTAILINLRDDFTQIITSEQKSLIRDTSCRSLWMTDWYWLINLNSYFIADVFNKLFVSIFFSSHENSIELIYSFFDHKKEH